MDPLKMHRLIVAWAADAYLRQQIEYSELTEIVWFADNTLGQENPDD